MHRSEGLLWSRARTGRKRQVLFFFFYLGALTGFSSPQADSPQTDRLMRLSITFPLLSTGATYKLKLHDRVLRAACQCFGA